MPSLCWALPNGLSERIPADLVIPDVPVKIIPDADNSSHFYVLPLEGMSSEIKDADVAYDLDCKSIKDTISELESKEQELRSIRTEVTGSESRELINEKDAKEEYVQRQTALKNQIASIDAKIKSLQDSRAKVEAEKKTSIDRVRELKAKLGAEEDVLLEAEVKSIKAEMEEATKAARKSTAKIEGIDLNIEKEQEARSSLQSQLDNLSYHVEGDNLADKQTRDDVKAQRDGIKAEVDDINEKLSEHRRKFGGNVKIVVNFAPTEFIQAVREANEDKNNYTFSYVPSNGGFVDVTFPINSDIIGYPVLGQKWDKAADKVNENPFSQALGKQGLDGKIEANGLFSTTNILEKLFRQFSDPLEGTRQVTLTFSEIGMCAFLDPRETIPGARQSWDTYSLSYFYSYPARFKTRAWGTVNERKMIDTLLERRKKSGWFSSSDRTKFVQTVTNNQHMDIKIDDGGLGPDVGNKLRERVKEYISFDVLKDELELRQGSPAVALQPLPPQAQGVNAASSALMRVPNPYAFWTGAALRVLGAGFGGSKTSFKKIEDYQANRVYNEVQQFTLPIGAVVTVGSLKPSNFKKK